MVQPCKKFGIYKYPARGFWAWAPANSPQGSGSDSGLHNPRIDPGVHIEMGLRFGKTNALVWSGGDIFPRLHARA